MEPPAKKPKIDCQKRSGSRTTPIQAPQMQTPPIRNNPSNATTVSLDSRLKEHDQEIKKLRQENERLKKKKYEEKKKYKERVDQYSELLLARELRIKELEEQLNPKEKLSEESVGDENGTANFNVLTDGGAARTKNAFEMDSSAVRPDGNVPEEEEIEEFVENGSDEEHDEMDDEREEGELSDESDDEEEQQIEILDQRKFKSLTRVRDPYKPVSRKLWIMGIVLEKCLVTKNGDKREKRTGPGTRLYSKLIGIVEGLDKENEENMQLGEVYNFQVSDKRCKGRTKNIRLETLKAVSPADWHPSVVDGIKSMDRDAFQITTSFHLAEVKMINDVHFFLDKFLTKVKIHEDDAERLKIYKQNNPREKIRVTSSVKTYQNYMEAYSRNPTNFIFVMTRILKVEKCKTGEVLYEENYNVVNG